MLFGLSEKAKASYLEPISIAHEDFVFTDDVSQKVLVIATQIESSLARGIYRKPESASIGLALQLGRLPGVQNDDVRLLSYFVLKFHRILAHNLSGIVVHGNDIFRL